MKSYATHLDNNTVTEDEFVWGGIKGDTREEILPWDSLTNCWVLTSQPVDSFTCGNFSVVSQCVSCWSGWIRLAVQSVFERNISTHARTHKIIHPHAYRHAMKLVCMIKTHQVQGNNLWVANGPAGWSKTAASRQPCECERAQHSVFIVSPHIFLLNWVRR